MIKDFKHKGLNRFFTSGSTSGINPEHAKKLRLRLATLHAAECIGDIDRPGYGLHALQGSRDGQWAVTVSGNWRITFEFIDGNAYIVNYEDYH
ncbi:Killer protein [Rahnella sp. AA]|uniref:type II toxin-antitoxin system RelE/ParE family toxin n=1 Tax=Rahnella sp. AA TaxID=2057180 RepID=UPI000C32D55E|nr:type II toxin-antitoxin system RelE/ParE family toxin [Rahnella sp. AA]PKE28365.1 Killer protein [Rahnella sp. AA]